MINNFNNFVNEKYTMNKNSFNYVLGDVVISEGVENDQLLEIIEKKKHKLLKEIRGFDYDKGNKYNTGVHSENIVRLLFDAVNLNHFQKNHPNVDIGVIKPIHGITKNKEVISVKSSISKTTPNGVLTDSKAIKLESLFSYLLFSYYNYSEKLKKYDEPENVDVKTIKQVEKKGHTPQMMLRDASEIIRRSTNGDFDYYKPMMNIITYHLITTRKRGSDFHSDIKNLSLIEDETKINDLMLSNGVKYSDALIYLNQEISKLTTPISIAVVYLPNYKEKGTTVTITKSKDLPLNIFWEKLLDKWCNKKYFNIFGKNDERVVKYLNGEEFKEIFGDWIVEINISTGNYQYRHKPEKVSRMYISNQLRDNRFGDTTKEERDALDVISKTIDTLSKDPSMVTRFKEFLHKIR